MHLHPCYFICNRMNLLSFKGLNERKSVVAEFNYAKKCLSDKNSRDKWKKRSPNLLSRSISPWGRRPFISQEKLALKPWRIRRPLHCVARQTECTQCTAGVACGANVLLTHMAETRSAGRSIWSSGIGIRMAVRNAHVHATCILRGNTCTRPLAQRTHTRRYAHGHTHAPFSRAWHYTRAPR